MAVKGEQFVAYLGVTVRLQPASCSITFISFDTLDSFIYVRVVTDKKRIKKAKAKVPKKPLGKSEIRVSTSGSLVDSTPVPVITEGPYGERIAMPPPEDLLREAEQEPNYRDLSHYTSVIRTLRDKEFSYRDIADWLSKRGVEVDHNAVYRVYTNSLSDYDAHLESEREDREAQEEAERNR